MVYQRTKLTSILPGRASSLAGGGLTGPIEIEIDKGSRLRAEWLFRRSPKILDRALRNAANRTVDWLRNHVAEMLQRELGTRSNRVKRSLQVIRARVRTPIATLVIKRKNVPIWQLDARQTKRGVSYQRGGQRRFIEHAFIAAMRSGHKGVFLRRALKRTGAAPQRRPRRRKAPGVFPDLPIAELFGPRLTTLIRQRPELLERIRAMAADKFRQNLDSQVKREMQTA